MRRSKAFCFRRTQAALPTNPFIALLMELLALSSPAPPLFFCLWFCVFGAASAASPVCCWPSTCCARSGMFPASHISTRQSLAGCLVAERGKGSGTREPKLGACSCLLLKFSPSLHALAALILGDVGLVLPLVKMSLRRALLPGGMFEVGPERCLPREVL